LAAECGPKSARIEALSPLKAAAMTTVIFVKYRASPESFTNFLIDFFGIPCRTYVHLSYGAMRIATWRLRLRLPLS
jgi:hypothetical protein